MITVDTNINEELRKAIRVVGRMQNELGSINEVLHGLLKLSTNGGLRIVGPEEMKDTLNGGSDDSRDGLDF